ncbi:MAG: DUF4139 domain-containing protein, partial [Pseudomonadota bacterium]
MIRLLLAAFLSTILVAADAQEQRFNSSITDVTVFLSGAQLTQEGSVKLQKGRNTVVMSQITPNVNPSSISVQGGDAFRIISAQFRQNPLSPLNVSKEQKQKKDSLAYAQMQKAIIDAEIAGYNEEKTLLQSNRGVKGANSLLLPEDLEEMADYIRTRHEQIEVKLFDLRIKQQEAQQLISRLQGSLNVVKGKDQQRSGEIVVVLEAQTALTTKLTCKYVVYNANWRPSYDVRVQDLGEPVELSYQAVVNQSTGVDWNNVRVTFSTGNPFQGNALPQLYPWYLNESYDFGKVTYGYEGAFEKLRERREPAAEDVAFNQMPQTQVTQSLVSTEFLLENRQTIKSSGAETRLEMKKYAIPAEYDYVAVPRRDKTGFLRGQITGWRTLNLMPGESNIYFQKTYVGKDYINSQQTNDTLNLSLGRDPGISMK